MGERRLRAPGVGDDVVCETVYRFHGTGRVCGASGLRVCIEPCTFDHWRESTAMLHRKALIGSILYGYIKMHYRQLANSFSAEDRRASCISLPRLIVSIIPDR